MHVYYRLYDSLSSSVQEHTILYACIIPSQVPRHLEPLYHVVQCVIMYYLNP